MSTTPKNQRTLDALIDAVPVTKARRCGVCADLDLSTMIVRWLDRRAAGEVLPSLETMYRELFTTVSTASASIIRRHICTCLRRNHRTGRPL
ncbi:MAG: hypothetical protein ACRDP6_38335 [Actinoallomurus sp.]